MMLDSLVRQALLQALREFSTLAAQIDTCARAHFFDDLAIELVRLGDRGMLVGLDADLAILVAAVILAVSPGKTTKPIRKLSRFSRSMNSSSGMSPRNASMHLPVPSIFRAISSETAARCAATIAALSITGAEIAATGRSAKCRARMSRVAWSRVMPSS